MPITATQETTTNTSTTNNDGNVGQPVQSNPSNLDSKLQSLLTKHFPDNNASPNSTSSEPTAETTSTPAPETPAVPAKEARKAYLEADKARRQADRQLQEAKQRTAQAEAFERAKQTGSRIEMLKALGEDPQRFYQELTEEALKTVAPVKEKDPVQQKVEEAIAPYVKEAQEAKQALDRHNEMVAEANAVNTRIVPIFKTTPDTFDTLIQMTGGVNQASLYVYNVAKDIYQKTGEVHDFAKLAQTLEDFHTEQLISTINDTSKYKKIANRSTPQAQIESPQTPQQLQATPQQLANLAKSPVDPNALLKRSEQPATNNRSSSWEPDPDKRRQNILKKFGQ